jgi:lambda family phage portal protein
MASRLLTAARAGVRAFRRSFDAFYPPLGGSLGGYDVAGAGARWPLAASLFSPVSQALAARHRTATRAGYLAENSPTAAAIVSAFQTAVCGGDGITARSNHSDKAQRQELEQLWNDWAGELDLEGISNLQHYAARVVRSLVVHGESFTRLVVDPGANLRVALLSPEQVDASKTVPTLGMVTNGPRIIAGVQIDQYGRREGYWIIPAPDVPGNVVKLPVFVPAIDVLHVFEPRHPGMVRGTSWLAPVATRVVELDQLEDAVLAKARVSALFTGYVKDVDGSSGLASGSTDTEGRIDPNSLAMEPGTLRFLPPGTDVTFPNMVDQSNIDAVLKHMVRSIAAGASVPYEVIGCDYSEVSFSSARMSAEHFKRRVGFIQNTLISGQLLQPLWARLMLLAILSGKIRAPDFEANPSAYLKAKFFYAQPEPLDPKKAADADATLLAARLKSRAELIAERSGRDVNDVDAEIKADPYQGEVTPTTAAAAVSQLETETDEVTND